MIVTEARYYAIVGDTSLRPMPAASAIADAEALISDALERPLESAERTETVRIRPDGLVYPSATPITAVQATSGLEIVSDFALRGAVALSGPFVGPIEVPPDRDLFAQVTYTGGWDATTVPAFLERDIAFGAYHLRQGHDLGPALTPAPVGATSVTVGDVSVSYRRPVSASETGFRLSAQTRRLRRRRI